MKSIRRDGSTIAAPGRSKDDRVMASALAAVAYAEQVQPRLIMRQVTRKVSHQQERLHARTIGGWPQCLKLSEENSAYMAIEPF